MPEVSVIVPNFNHEPYLKQRIDSILGQTYQDFELIILDDCSSDNSRNIINKYRNHRKVADIVFNESNSGSTFRQWKKGLGLAKGRWIWFAESDDYSGPEFLRTCINILQGKNTGMVFCNSIQVDEHDVLIEAEVETGEARIFGGSEFIKDHMVIRNTLFNASAVVFEKDLASGLIDDMIMSFRYCGDWLFWIKMLERSNVARVGKNLNYFRKHLSNVSNSAERKGLFFIEGMEVLRYIKTTGLLSYDDGVLLDKMWASKLSKSKYKPGIFLAILAKSLRVNPLFPGYYVYYKFRKLLDMKYMY
ncbi:MAG: glycosyltransferase [Chitinophagaceae bacterium]